MDRARVCLYYKPVPEGDRWVLCDRYVRQIVRRVVRGRPRIGGVDKVFLNLCKGLDRLKVYYELNERFDRLKPGDRVGILGRGRRCMDGYDRPNPIVAGPALMAHPSEWPTLCEEYPVVRYLQHSEWANNVYKPYFGDRCRIWPVGIDTDEWSPVLKKKELDFLIYDKILWDYQQRNGELLEPIKRSLLQRGLSFETLRYGNYSPNEFKSILTRSQAMIFLCEHESQGIAYQEALSSGVPILAWDQGWWLDPNRLKWGETEVPATSVPYFDERCGLKFKDLSEFESKVDEFITLLKAGVFSPREYILGNLTLEKCSRHYLDILSETALADPHGAT